MNLLICEVCVINKIRDSENGLKDLTDLRFYEIACNYGDLKIVPMLNRISPVHECDARMLNSNSMPGTKIM